MKLVILILTLGFLSNAYAAAPLNAAASAGVLFNRTNKNVAPDGLNAVMNTVGLTNLEADASIKANYSSATSVSYFDGTGYLKSFGQITPTISGLTSVGTNAGWAFVTDVFRGGTFYWTNSATTNLGITFPASVGYWVRYIHPGTPITPQMFGAIGDGTTDDTLALEGALAYVSSIRTELYIPAGKYKFTNTLTASSGVTLRGAGTGRDGTSAATTLFYSGSGTAIQKSGTNAVFNFCLKDLTLLGTDGSGGVGLLMDSFQYSTLDNVQFQLFRNVGDTGIGISMVNSNGNCAFNNFYAVRIEDCDTALLMDSANATNATGYNYFSDLVIYQEEDCVILRSTQDNGSIYNTFNGLYIQGSPAASGDCLYIEGLGNKISAYNVDQSGSGKVLWFAKTNASNNKVIFLGGWDDTKYQNDQTVGIGNIVDGDGSFYHSPGKLFFFRNTDGDTEVSFFSSSGGTVEQHFGNDTAGSQSWRFMLEASTATPRMDFRNGNSKVWRFLWAGTTELPGSVVLLNGSGVYGTSTNGATEAMLITTSANNVQVGSHSISGDLQLISRSTNGSISMLTGNPTTLVMALQGDGDINVPLLTPSKIAVIDANNNLVSGSVGESDLAKFSSFVGTNGITVTSNASSLIISLAVTNTTQLTFAQPGVTLTTSTNSQFLVMKNAATLKAVTAYVLVPSSSGNVTFDLWRNGSSILSAPVSLAPSATNATATLSATAISAGDILTPICTGAGTDTEGAAFLIEYTRP